MFHTSIITLCGVKSAAGFHPGPISSSSVACGDSSLPALFDSFIVAFQEWVNPTESADFNPRGEFQRQNFCDELPFVSQTNAFKTFMLRANRYKLLPGLGSENSDSDSTGKIVLIEELPSFAFRKKEDFQDILIQVRLLYLGHFIGGACFVSLYIGLFFFLNSRAMLMKLCQSIFIREK